MKHIQVKRHDGNYFYKATDVFSEGMASDIATEAYEWISNNRKPITSEVYPPETCRASYELLKNTPFWSVFYAEIKKHIAKYCEVTGIDSSLVSIDESWMTKVDDIEIPGKHSRDSLRRRLKQNNTFGNMHSHEHNQIGIVYYAKNPDPKFGTLVKLSENKIFKNDGEVNSLLIFNPQLYHTAVYPTLEDIQNNGERITIVLDCIMEESNQENQTED